jgi:hypothetical protein
VVLGTVGLLLVLQLVPYGRDHDNPAVSAEPPWVDDRTRDLAVSACFDCHSNQTDWPWYSHVAPVSWLLQRDVDDGRAVLNFSEWDREQKEADDAAEVVVESEMPPSRYLPLHPDARLSQAEKADLARGLAATTGDDDS